MLFCGVSQQVQSLSIDLVIKKMYIHILGRRHARLTETHFVFLIFRQQETGTYYIMRRSKKKTRIVTPSK